VGVVWYIVDDDCFYYYSWRNNVVIAFGTLSSFLTYLHIVSGVVCVEFLIESLPVQQQARSSTLMLDLRKQPRRYFCTTVKWRGGGLGSRPILKKFHETYAPS